MMRIFSSLALTACLGVLMALYLVLGRQGVLPLHAAGMVGLAALLILQSGFALAYRLFRLGRKVSCADAASAKQKWDTSAGSFTDAERMLAASGFHIAATCAGGITIFAKHVRAALAIEVVLYGTLITALLLGLINYASGISGSFMVSPAIASVAVTSAVQDLQRGFLADLSGLDYKIKVDALGHATDGKPSAIDIGITDRQEKQVFSGKLNDGDAFRLNNFRVRYDGDMFLLYLTVMKKDHDFLPGAVSLFRDTGSHDAIYRGRLDMREPGAFGEAEYEPDAGMLRVRIYEKGRLAFDKRFAESTEAMGGDFRVGVTASGHFGRFDFRKYTYRNQILGGLALLIASLFVRVIWRPSDVYVRSEDGIVHFSTKNRAVRKVLSEG